MNREELHKTADGLRQHARTLRTEAHKAIQRNDLQHAEWLLDRSLALRMAATLVDPL